MLDSRCYYRPIYLNLKRSCDPVHIPFGVLYHLCTTIVLLCINQHMILKMPSFTNSKDMIGVAKI